jgi:flavin-dependent dehydrogenase
VREAEVLEAEVLIVGAGPAGATAAINLAPLRRVVLVESKAEVMPRIGESLVPAARRLFEDMGLLESFLAEGHEPWYGNRTVWGGPELQEVDFLSDPDGHGWHLDRARFEQWLRDTAIARGAELISPATAEKLTHDGRRWQVILKTAAGPLVVACDLLIDAGGRAAPLGRRLGARAQVNDRLVCAWMYGRDERDTGRGLTYVEAAQDGWWYTAPLPGQRRVLAFHTDADLPSARIARYRGGLLAHAEAVKELSALLVDVGFVAQSERGTTAAHSAMLEPPASDRWLAVGDAAICFDPLSSQGLLNALFTSLAGAEAADSHLKGDTHSLPEYKQVIRGIADAYRQHLDFFYAIEMRWPKAPFWQRRHVATYSKT